MNRLFLAAALSVAASSARADVIRTLERGTAYAAQSKTEQTLFIPAGKSVITLHGDSDRRFIGVNHAFSSTGFFLQKDGTLSTHDRARLGDLLAKEKVTRETITHGLRNSILARRAYEAKLATVDDKVEAILADAKLAVGKSYGPHLRYTPNGPTGAMLVVSEGLSMRAIYLGGNRENGFSLSPSDRAEVARQLLR